MLAAQGMPIKVAHTGSQESEPAARHPRAATVSLSLALLGGSAPPPRHEVARVRQRRVVKQRVRQLLVETTSAEVTFWPEEPHKDRHVELHRSQRTFEDVSYSLIWNSQTFLDKTDKKYYVARAPGSLCRLADGASVDVRDSTARATSGQGPLRPPRLTSTR